MISSQWAVDGAQWQSTCLALCKAFSSIPEPQKRKKKRERGRMEEKQLNIVIFEVNET
jgi:hypothetical protein